MSLGFVDGKTCATSCKLSRGRALRAALTPCARTQFVRLGTRLLVWFHVRTHGRTTHPHTRADTRSRSQTAPPQTRRRGKQTLSPLPERRTAAVEVKWTRCYTRVAPVQRDEASGERRLKAGHVGKSTRAPTSAFNPV